MIYAKQVRLVEMPSQSIQNVLAAIEIPSERLLDDDATESSSIGGCHARGSDCLAGFGEYVGGNGKIKQPIDFGDPLLSFQIVFPRSELGVQILPSVSIAVSLSGLIATPGQKLFDHIVRDFATRVSAAGLAFQIRTESSAQVVVGHGRAGVAVNEDVGGEEVVGEQAEEGGVGFLFGEVAGRADDDYGEAFLFGIGRVAGDGRSCVECVRVKTGFKLSGLLYLQRQWQRQQQRRRRSRARTLIHASWLTWVSFLGSSDIISSQGIRRYLSWNR